jgi:hypothetical protein
MADEWKCPTCSATLRCSCQSMECSFDYDIRAHVRRDLIKAIETALAWMEVKAVNRAIDTALDENKEPPCCQSCLEN